MSIKELFEKIFGEIAKLFTAKNGVRNFIYLIIALFIGNSIIDFVAFRKQCARYHAMHSEYSETSCKVFKDEIGVDVWEEMYGD
jgi:hypothetical protein